MHRTKLTILEIRKRTTNKNMLCHRWKRKKFNCLPYLRMQRKKRNLCTSNIGVQVCKKTQDAAIETKSIDKLIKWTNTKHRRAYSDSTQTERNLLSMATQCFVSMDNRYTQCEYMRVSLTTQTEIKYLNKMTQTLLDDTLELQSMQSEYKNVLTFFNEMCKMLLHQNDLMNNNSTMLGQIAEIILLKHITVQKNLNVCEKTKKLHRKHSFTFMGRKPKMKVLPRILKTKDVHTQTLVPILKTNRFVSFFKHPKSLNNKSMSDEYEYDDFET